MSWCDADGECKRPGEYIPNPEHTFSGYGYWCCYHAECCPQHMDGSDCTASIYVGRAAAHEERRDPR